MKREKILLATTNKGKIKEIKSIIKDLPYEIISIDDLKKLPKDFQVEETGESFKENAAIKAETIGKLSGYLTIADDSGLEVDALSGRPGVFSSRYGKTTSERNEKLLNELKEVSIEKRKARFICAIAVFDPREKRMHFFNGRTEGIITNKPMGKLGFGYDPVFFSKELGKTFSQAASSEKNKVSHRARALFKAKAFLREYSKTNK